MGAPTAPSLRVLFDIQHPAQVHLFKHAVWDLQRAGHETRVLSRDKEVTLDLLDAYGIDHSSLSRRRNGLPATIMELGVRELRTYLNARSFRPDVIVSRVSPPAAHAASLLDARSVIVTDTDIDSTFLGRIFHAITLPFADVVCRPPGLELPTAARKQRIVGSQELAYLHPDRFTPDAPALERHGVTVDAPYFVVRRSGWDAYHDVGHKGITTPVLEDLIDYLSEHGTVYLSTEGGAPAGLSVDGFPVPPELLHDLLYYADLYVGDSGTMSTEAAMLGTPAVRTNTMAGPGDEPLFRSLEMEYELLFSFSSGQDVLRKVRELLTDDTTPEIWQQNRIRFLQDTSDVTDQIVSIILEAGEY